MIKVGIVGVTGYTGIELVRCLKLHPDVSITHYFSRNTSLSDLSGHYPFLKKNEAELEVFDPSVDYPIDVLFLATPHNQSHQWMAQLMGHRYKIIDLSADFRLSPEQFLVYYGSEHESPTVTSSFVRGFTEIYRNTLKTASYCANPGCFSTAAVLGLYPLSSHQSLNNVIVDAKSGVSGKGKKVDEGNIFCETNESFMPYGTGQHRHTPEIELEVQASVLFSPHLIPMNRGILASCYVDNDTHLDQQTLSEIYEKMYGDEPFIRLLGPEEPIKSHYATGSNLCLIKPIVVANKIVIFSAIDNVQKGASGQAIQNMNVMMGIRETRGLSDQPVFP